MSSSSDRPLGCTHTVGLAPLPATREPEGEFLPAPLSSLTVVDAHVHVFPNRLFDAIWSWFGQHAWEIRYQLYSDDVIKFLLNKGIKHVVTLNYSHKTGMSRSLNEYSEKLMHKYPGRVIAMGTVLPGEEKAEEILEDAFKRGLYGIKLHSHVQLMAADDWEKMDVIYKTCVKHSKPIIFHAGQEPSSPGYKCDTYAICSADRIERVLQRYPTLKLCVPHLGAAEYDKYYELIEKYPNLYLDTTMVVGYWFKGEAMNPPIGKLTEILHKHPQKIMYGSDFPNIPHAWDREINKLVEIVKDKTTLEWIFGKTAIQFYNIPTRTSHL